ncbi:hypothetical protein [Pseudonocardia sp. T1-2H]|uniref:hypothetical protein n=1 Tax=Pseudonocardia sp. T1-2H TaxID=3128899 RepID=UPI003100AFC5
MIHSLRLYPDTYVDSVVQLSGTRALRASDGVDWAAAAMATPANLEELGAQGFDLADAGGAGPNDLFIAVRAESEDAADAARAAGRRRCSAPAAAGPAARTPASARRAPSARPSPGSRGRTSP